jgi:hypothetical protein
MKVTLETLFEAHPAFQILANQFFALDKIVSARKLIDQVNLYYLEIAKKQEELLSFYGNKEENGKFTVEDDKKSFYEKELKEFLSKEVELDWEPVEVERLGDISMPLQAYQMLEFLFVSQQAVS